MTEPFEHKCKRCNYEWLGKIENPKACPKCNSPYWNKDRTKNVIRHQLEIDGKIISEGEGFMDTRGKDWVHNQIYTKGVEFNYDALNTDRKLEINVRDMITYAPEPLLVIRESGGIEVRIFDPLVAKYIRYLMSELDRLRMER